LTWISQIKQRISEYLEAHPSFSTRMRTSCKNLMHYNTTSVVELLEDFFRQRHTRLLAASNELILQTTLEILWFEEGQCLAEVHLVLDSNKKHGDGRNGFVDIFASSSREIDASYSILVLELKNVPLRYLWKARQQTPTAEPTSQNDFEPLLGELDNATEDQLLNLKYSFFDKNIGKYVTLRVRDTLQAAVTQLGGYVDVISRGQGGTTAPGIADFRVCCQNGGQDVLLGYVIICVGGTRVICKHTVMRPTNYSYIFTGIQTCWSC
jgi:hypothetical protein